MAAKLAFILLLSTLNTSLLRQHKNRADQSGPIRQREAWVPIDRAHTGASQKNVLLTSFAVLTLRAILKIKIATWRMTSRMDILAWMNTKRASDDHRS